MLVTGPRQSGKTTFLVHESPPGHGYISFDDPLNRNLASDDPNALLDPHDGRPLVLDEIQYVPDLLRYLRVRIDRHRERRGCSSSPVRSSSP